MASLVNLHVCPQKHLLLPKQPRPQVHSKGQQTISTCGGLISHNISYLPFVSSQIPLEVQVHFKARVQSEFFQVHSFIFRGADDQGPWMRSQDPLQPAVGCLAPAQSAHHEII